MALRPIQHCNGKTHYALGRPNATERVLYKKKTYDGIKMRMLNPDAPLISKSLIGRSKKLRCATII